MLVNCNPCDEYSNSPNDNLFLWFLIISIFLIMGMIFSGKSRIHPAFLSFFLIMGLIFRNCLVPVNFLLCASLI
uniref:Uncharacterized protein n=1 Tax=Rhizophora mucronata TaxID=61149 RepID=A0A2P2QJW7_RHIMU